MLNGTVLSCTGAEECEAERAWDATCGSIRAMSAVRAVHYVSASHPCMLTSVCSDARVRDRSSDALDVYAHSGEAGGDTHEGCARRIAAASRLQRFWRARSDRRTTLTLNSQLVGVWASGGRRAAAAGRMEPHILFLQFYFRATRILRPGCWSAGALRAPALASRLLWWAGPARRCNGGANLATDREFEMQRELSGRMLDWYGVYATILRRLESGVAPKALNAFCGAGGDAEGCRRAGGSSVGVDDVDQPEFVARFGAESFVRGDATSWSEIVRVKEKHGAFGFMGGPPCKFYSTARVRGVMRGDLRPW